MVTKWSIQSEFKLIRNWEISEVAQHKRMQMIKGEQMLNNGVGTSSIHGFHVFLYLSQMVSHSSHIIVSFNHSYFHIQGKQERAFGLISAPVLLLDSSGLFCFFGGKKGDMCL